MGDRTAGAKAAKELLATDAPLRRKIAAFAYSLTGSLPDASDLSQEAMAKVIDPTGSPWEPSEQPNLFLHVGSVMSSVVANRRRAHERHPGTDYDPQEDMRVDPEPPAIEPIARAENMARLARTDAQSEEEIDRTLREAGIEPEVAAKVGMDLLTKGPAEKAAPAPVAPSVRPPDSRGMRKSGRHAPKVSGVTWLAIAAVVALVIAALWGRQDTVAQAPTPPIAPSHSEAPKEPSLEDRAEPIRGDAYAACEVRLWDRCEAKLNEARELDPAGEAQPRVLTVRQLLDRVRRQHQEGGKSDKPSR